MSSRVAQGTDDGVLALMYLGKLLHHCRKDLMVTIFSSVPQGIIDVLWN